MDATSAETTVEGLVDRITYENEETGFRVLRIQVEGRRDPLTLVGTFPPLAVGSQVRARGTFVDDKRHGLQFRAEGITELRPNTLPGLEKYLGSGLIKGVGEVIAKRIVDKFGLETLRVLDEEPHRLGEVEGLGTKRAGTIAKAWTEQRAVGDVMVFLQSHGASPALAMRIFKKYGSKATTIVSRDPYRLSIEVWGVGFRTADRIAASLGISGRSLERMQAGMLHALGQQVEAGHVYTEWPVLAAATLELLELPSSDDGLPKELRQALDALARDRHVFVETESAPLRIYPSALDASERRVVAGLCRLLERKAPISTGVDEALAAFEAQTGLVLAPEQREAVHESTRTNVLVVTGGPGVGKTTLVRAIIAVAEYGGRAVRLAAPTGRAAKRLSEASGQEAVTLHRLLEFEPRTGQFRRGLEHPLEGGLLIVDEASMVDLAMADALLSALSEEARLVLVGDVDQLPSVGPGAVLRDILDSHRVPAVRLTQIFRQASESLIVTNAHRIQQGKEPVVPPRGQSEGDFFMMNRGDPDEARKLIVELVAHRIPRRFGLDPMRDVQVLTPMHRGPCGATALNEALQATINPVGDALVRGTRVFRAGDKVMQLRNDYDRNVWNGDIGWILAIHAEDKTVTVGFDPKAGHPATYERVVTYEPSNLDELTLAYACTIHKSQGSEYPAVVIPLLSSHHLMLTRNLLYTAVTRGKRLVVLVTDPKALAIALEQGERDGRRTTLLERLQGSHRPSPDTSSLADA